MGERTGMSERVITLLLTEQEIDVLAVAMARSVLPDSQAQDAWEAAKDVWSAREQAGPELCSLATMLAEAR